MSTILKSLVPKESSQECLKKEQPLTASDSEVASILHENNTQNLEVIINRMEDGFAKVYMHLEALDERLQDVQNMSDKVDMLEASVRLLENHAFMWPIVNNFEATAESSLSSSSLHSSSPVITTLGSTGSPGGRMMAASPDEEPALKSRSLPKRNHTIGSIKYDSTAFSNKVSFNLGSEEDLPRSRPASVASKRHKNEGSHYDDLHRGANKLCAQVLPSIVRSKSFSNDVDFSKATSASSAASASAASGGKGRHEKRGRTLGSASIGGYQLQLPSARTQSLRIAGAHKSPPSRSSRFSWGTREDMPEHGGGTSPVPLKDSKYRGSVTSLTSDIGSGATTPTPTTSKGITFDISAKELMKRDTVRHNGTLEMKKTSGFKSYKRYWAVLDAHFLYLYSREKDSKAKQVIDVTDCNVTEAVASYDLSHHLHHSSSSANSNSNTPTGNTTSGSSLNSSSFRESLKKRGGRSFELIFNNGESRYFAASNKDEADEWMRRIRKAAADKVYEQLDRDHLALEQDYEDEVLHECTEATASALANVAAVSAASAPRGASGGYQQEWRAAFKHQSRDASRLANENVAKVN